MKLARLAAVLCFSVLFAAPASARIEVTLDAESLNGILASMAPDTVEVGLAAGKSVVI